MHIRQPKLFQKENSVMRQFGIQTPIETNDHCGYNFQIIDVPSTCSCGKQQRLKRTNLPSNICIKKHAYSGFQIISSLFTQNKQTRSCKDG